MFLNTYHITVLFVGPNAKGPGANPACEKVDGDLWPRYVHVLEYPTPFKTG